MPRCNPRHRSFVTPFLCKRRTIEGRRENIMLFLSAIVSLSIPFEIVSLSANISIYATFFLCNYLSSDFF